jgi:hypothetical protein
MYCAYYQAHVKKETGWFVVGILKSFEHMMFDRTIDVEHSIFEFFVSPSAEQSFLQIMDHFEQQGYISDLKKLPNRLADSSEEL